MINPDPENIPPYRLDQLMMTFDPLIGLDTQRLIDMLEQIRKATAIWPLTRTARSQARAASSSTTANPPRRTTDMGQLETQTTHTVKLAWKYRAVFDKREFVSRLNAVVPDSAIITGISISDAPMAERGTTNQVVMRSLAITYVADSRELPRW